MTTALSMAELNRATLARQLLLERAPLTVPDAVRRVYGMQAQHAASPYLALWNRVADFDPAEADRAFTDATVVKASLMRITLHAVHAEDLPATWTALQPTLRSARLGDRRFTQTGLTIAQADQLIPELLPHLDQPRSGAELEERIAEVSGVAGKWVWWALRTYGPFRHAPVGPPWSFGWRPVFVASGLPPTPYDPEASDLALRHLVRRYLAAFGPASIADVAQFALVQRARVRAAVTALEPELRRFTGPDGVRLVDVADGPLPLAETPAPPRLLPMWESTLLAYADRTRVLPERYRKVVIRSNGDVLPSLLVEGRVAGVWRSTGAGIEVTAFHHLPEPVWEQVEAEAAGLRDLLAPREVEVYSRYHHWWSRLPEGETRVLSR